MEEETIFWTLSTIVEILLPGYHEESLLGYHAECRVIETLLENHDLRLYRHLRGTFTLEMSFVGIASLCSSWCYNAFHLYFGKYNNPIFLSISANKDLFLVVFILVFRFSSISNCS